MPAHDNENEKNDPQGEHLDILNIDSGELLHLNSPFTMLVTRLPLFVALYGNAASDHNEITG